MCELMSRLSAGGRRGTAMWQLGSIEVGVSSRIMTNLGPTGPVLNQGDQGENLIPPSLILIPDIPDIPDIGAPWVPSVA